MRKRLLCIAGIVIAAALWGCSQQYLLEDEQGNILGAPERKHKILSFFFDGVPPPGGEAEQEGERKNGDAAAGTMAKFRYGDHGPYAAKLCEACHLRGSNKLVMPEEELCSFCHELKTNKKKLHGPLAAGGCTVCHDPHGSSYRYLLVAEPREFCYYCHEQQDVLRREVHQGTDLQCTVCHDAHAADNEYLLK